MCVTRVVVSDYIIITCVYIYQLSSNAPTLCTMIFIHNIIIISGNREMLRARFCLFNFHDQGHVYQNIW